MALTWVTPTFTNGAYGSAQYSIDAPTGSAASIVRWRGAFTVPVASGSTISPVAFTVGAGGRPLQAMSIPTSDPAGLRIMSLLVDPSGAVQLAVRMHTGSDPETVDLDGIVTPGEQ